MLLQVQRGGDSGPPRVAGSTSRSNAGTSREWQPRESPRLSMCTPSLATRSERRFPTAFYDVAANNAFVTVGADHDTPVFAAASIETWWKLMGRSATPMQPTSSSLPMPAAAMATVHASGKKSFNDFNIDSSRSYR